MPSSKHLECLLPVHGRTTRRLEQSKENKMVMHDSGCIHSGNYSVHCTNFINSLASERIPVPCPAYRDSFVTEKGQTNVVLIFKQCIIMHKAIKQH